MAVHQRLINQTKTNWSIDWSALADDARKLLKQGVTDPLANAELGQILIQDLKTNNGDDALIESAFGLAMNNLILPDYSHHSIMRLSYAQANLLHYKNKSNTVEEIGYFMDDILYWLCETPFEQDQLRYAYSKFGQTGSFNYLKKNNSPKITDEHLETVEQHKGQIDPWLYHMLKGKLLSRKAWQIRGSGYADTVKEKAFKEFHKNLALAAKDFEAAYTINPNFPEAAIQMISNAGASRTALSIEGWVNRVLESEWDNGKLYSRYLNFLMPRWGGSHSAMLRVGEIAAQSKRYDTELPMVYFTAVRSVINDAPKTYKHLLSGKVMTKLRDILSGYEAFNMQQKNPDRFLQYKSAANMYSLYILTEDYTSAYKLFLKYGEKLNQKESFKDFHNTMTMERSAQKCFVLGSGQASDSSITIMKALNWAPYVQNGSIPNRSLSDVTALLKLAEEELNKSPSAIETSFLRQSMQLLQMEKTFHSGIWVPLTFSENLPLWEKFHGNFKVINKNIIHGDTFNKEEQHLMSLAMFHPPYTIELTVDCIKPNTRYNMLYAGIVCGKLKSNPRGMLWWADTNKKRLGITDPHKESPEYYSSINKEPVTIRVNVFKGHYDVYYNGILRRMQNKDNFYPGRVGIAIQDDYTMSGIVSYKNFRIRKLPYGSLPKDKSDQVRLDYYLERLQHDQQYLLNFWASVHAINLGQNALSTKHSLAALEQLPLTKESFHLTPSINMNLGAAYKGLGEYKKAIENYDTALTIAQKHKKPATIKKCLLRLSLLLSSSPDIALCDEPRSLLLAKNALTIDKKDPESWNHLAVAQAANGDFKTAIESDKKAQSLSTDKGYIKDLDGEIALFEQEKRYFLEKK